MNDLRISLIVISVLAIVLVYLLGWLNRRQSRDSRERRFEPSMQSTPVPESGVMRDDADFDIKLVDGGGERLLFPEAENSSTPVPAFAVRKHGDAESAPPLPPRDNQPPSADAAPAREAAPGPVPERVIVLNVVAREGRPFRGDAIARTLETLGLSLGEMDFFHSYDTDETGRRHAVFSVASMVRPGTFDRATLADLSTPGLSLFMQVPGPIAASEAFDAMYQCAGSIAVRLGGAVCDERREPLTPLGARAIREALLARDFSAAVQQPPARGAGEHR